MVRKTKKQIVNERELKFFIISLTAIALLVVGLFEFGSVGVFINRIMRVLVGDIPQIYYGLLITLILYLIFRPEKQLIGLKKKVALGLMLLSFILIQSLLYQSELVGSAYIQNYWSRIPQIFKDSTVHAYSGLFGALVYGVSSSLLGKEGTMIFIGLYLVIAIALFASPAKVVSTVVESKDAAVTNSKTFFSRFKRKEKKVEESLPTVSDESIDALINRNFEAKEHDVKASFLTVEKDEGDVSSTRKPEQVKAVLSVGTLPETESISMKLDLNPNRATNFDHYKLPSINLLEGLKGNQRSSSNESAAKRKSTRLIEVLAQFGIEAQIVGIHIGPAVTKFELKPDSNVKISKISSIQDNLMMELAVKTLRIEAPIPGKSAVGIEIPNEEMIPVRMKEVINSSPNFMANDNINVALGKDLTGKPITVALNKMPHLLIAGATGSGKSVCMNAIITSIILSKRPDELQLLLIDPKKVEFAPFVDIPHLIGPVISDPMQAATALKVIVEQMENRYELFSRSGVRNISTYNQNVADFPEENKEKMPWIVVIIDELADLMAVAGKDVEMSIQRITQLARAAGIHLIVATQRPSVDVVTGVIKANIPSRIAFAVSSSIDSRTILDSVGAEKLLGYGDMLYVPMGEPHAIRVQGVYVSDEEVKRIAQKSSDQAMPRFNDAFITLDGVGTNGGIVSSSDDPLYEEAYRLVVAEQKASTSWLQRQFRIGYNRAASLMDALEQNGVIGPASGSRPRLVLVHSDESEEE